MKVKEVGRGPGLGSLVFWPCALEQSPPPGLYWGGGGDLLEVSLRPQGQGWAVITSGGSPVWNFSDSSCQRQDLPNSFLCASPSPPTPFPPPPPPNLH
jgi:hypothetical protein